MADDKIHKPTPRRSFILGDSFETDTDRDSIPESELLGIPNDHNANPSLSGLHTPGGGYLDPLRRSQSIRNMTSSALYGIFQAAYDSVPSTPGLTRNQSYAHIADIANGYNTSVPTSPILSTPRKTIPLPRRRVKPPQSTAMLILRAVLLFFSGAAYGFIVLSLNDRGRLTPVHITISKHSPVYLTIWGLAGVAMGSLLPFIDRKYEDYVYTAMEEEIRLTNDGRLTNGRAQKSEEEIRAFTSYAGGGEEVDSGPSWSPVMRSVGTFVGIAYAIRKLPWESTSQASATLAFANPALWYLIDRSITGFFLSSAVAVTGTLALLLINPDFIPQAVVPLRVKDGAMNNSGGNEALGATTWIASVLFCSAVCFGNIGRRLAGSYKVEGERKY